MRATCLALVVTVGCAGTRHLDPPPQPQAVVPPVGVPPDPPPPGVSRVYFDVVDGQSQIQIKSQQPNGAVWSPLCVTPCAADIPAGQHEISFQMRADPAHGDTDLLTVVPGTSVYRRALGGRDNSPALLLGGYVVSYTGVLVTLVGLMVAGLETRANDHSARDTALVGLGMTIGGGLMFYYGWPTEQPGSVTQFALPPRQ